MDKKTPKPISFKKGQEYLNKKNNFIKKQLNLIYEENNRLIVRAVNIRRRLKKLISLVEGKSKVD